MSAPACSLLVEAGGSQRRVLSWGDEAAPAIMMIHGMRDHAYGWEWVAARLRDRFRVLAPDLRGHGDSDWTGSYSIADYVIDIADVADQLGLKAFYLVGHSLGAHIALRYTASFPDRVCGLCAIEGMELPIVRDERLSPKPYPARLRQWIDDERQNRERRPRVYRDIEHARQRMQDQNPAIDPEIIARLTERGVVAAEGGVRWKYDNACRFRPPEDARGADLDDMLDAVTCPVLLAYGEESWIPVPPRARLARLRNAEVVTFPGSSHWVHHQARDPFVAALSDFLENRPSKDIHQLSSREPKANERNEI